MPTVLRWRSYRAFFYSNEGNEPPHVHVRSARHLDAPPSRGMTVM
ncbi:DUF4160 domain-containing protein [Bradyrhizobium sp.]|nr:DUF4160 domain-containing protein [Bradyrhizobium sp.]